jgi:hypothetical protein
MKIIGTKSITETIHISDNYVWSSKETNVYRTIFGIRLWKISCQKFVCKYGEPYIAKV